MTNLGIKSLTSLTLLKKISIGVILYKIQEPYIILILIGIVLLIGIVAYYIAGRLDKRDMKKTTENSY